MKVSNIIDFGLLQDKKMITLSWRKIDVAIDICMSEGNYILEKYWIIQHYIFFICVFFKILC